MKIGSDQTLNSNFEGILRLSWNAQNTNMSYNMFPDKNYVWRDGIHEILFHLGTWSQQKQTNKQKQQRNSLSRDTPSTITPYLPPSSPYNLKQFCSRTAPLICAKDDQSYGGDDYFKYTVPIRGPYLSLLSWLDWHFRDVKSAVSFSLSPVLWHTTVLRTNW